MGRWVFADACRQLAEWRRRFPRLRLVVRVNMSPAQFATDEIVDFVENCMRVYDVPGDRLCIEMTEHAVMAEPEKTARILRGFQSLGVEIALDDFGTGYSSMTELKRLPVNLLKLDTSFVQGITSDPRDRAIVEAIIRLGRALDLEIVAEGIETSATIDKLLELGCHRGQGYLLSTPIAPDELTSMLEMGGISLSALRSARSASLPAESRTV
jgi:EAL domain-containing protein (putative c-di-GMP-specific phosphodiesterase class I)